LKKKPVDSGINYGSIATDDWDSFVSTFKGENHLVGKKYTVGIVGNNCRLRHRIRRAFRKTCCFSKKLINHFTRPQDHKTLKFKIFGFWNLPAI
jgi:IS1 family transposase